MEKGHIGEYTGNNTKLMKSPEIKYAGDIADETAQAHEGSPAYRKASPLNQSMHKKLEKIEKKKVVKDPVYDESNRESRPIMQDLPHHSQERWDEYQARGWASDDTVTPYRMHMEKNLVPLSRKSSPLNDMAGGLTHAQMSEKSPENLAGHLKNRDAHKRGVSRKSSPLNADYVKDMAELRIKIKHAKEDIWEDDKKKWENK